MTGVPGAGKTLVGLNLAIEHANARQGEHAVFLSGNQPLVSVLQEALARDKVKQASEEGEKISKEKHYEKQAPLFKSYINIGIVLLEMMMFLPKGLLFLTRRNGRGQKK